MQLNKKQRAHSYQEYIVLQKKDIVMKVSKRHEKAFHKKGPLNDQQTY